MEELNETSESVQVLEQNDSKPKKRKEQKNGPSKAEQRKLQKLKKAKKRARIIIRNLPFTLSEEALRERFSKYGNITELKIPQNHRGKRVGFCFLQFDRVQSAAQAIHHENLQTVLNRKIVVDWSLAKDKYEKINPTNSTATEVTEVKEEADENLNDSEITIKEEQLSDEEEIKMEEDSDDGVKEERDSVEEQSDDDVSSKDENEEDELDDVKEIDEDEDDKRNVKIEMDNESVNSQHPRRISNDVNEGKTVFIKNVPFTAKNEDLKECMQQFGPVYYALVCMDHLTEHSKGTAFVKFIVMNTLLFY